MFHFFIGSYHDWQIMNNEAVGGGGGGLYFTCTWPSAAMLEIFTNNSSDKSSVGDAGGRLYIARNTARWALCPPLSTRSDLAKY